MRSLVTVSLDDHVFALEEGGYEALRQWLEQAQTQARLAAVGGPEQHLVELERSIARQCDQALEQGGEWISEAQIKSILAAMGSPEAALAAIRADPGRRRRHARSAHHWLGRWRGYRGVGPSATTRADARALSLLAGVLMPLAALVHALLLIGLVIALAQLFGRGAVFGWPVPTTMPIWAAALILLAIYYVVSTPLRVIRQSTQLARTAGADATWVLWSTLLWLGLVALALWLGWREWPALQRLLQELINSVRGPPAGQAIVWLTS